jgi:methylenetetrahydrofolate reductase (NADPH)
LIGSAPVDLLRSRLDRGEWTVTVEVVTPAPDDEAARARVLMLADALRDDDRVAALTLTDRTVAADADPIALAPHVALRSGKAPLVHLAGKGRDRRAIEAALRRADDAGITSLLLTSGDVLPTDVLPTLERAGVSLGARDLLTLASTVAPGILRLGVLDDTYDRAEAKRDAGAAGLIAQVSWDLGVRETAAGWQTRLGVPISGAVMLLTRGRLEFVAHHRIGGIVVPPALRRRVMGDSLDAAMRRLALDLVMLRRLGYAGAHLSGLLTPSRVAHVLDDAAHLDASLGNDWRGVWREAVGIA